MTERVISCTAIIERQDDGTYSVIVEISGLRRERAFEVADMLEQPVVNALERFGDVKPISTGFGHA